MQLCPPRELTGNNTAVVESICTKMTAVMLRNNVSYAKVGICLTGF